MKDTSPAEQPSVCAEHRKARRWNAAEGSQFLFLSESLYAISQQIAK